MLLMLLMHWCCWCWCIWADIPSTAFNWCCWNADALMLLMHWCCWSNDAAVVDKMQIGVRAHLKGIAWSSETSEFCTVVQCLVFVKLGTDSKLFRFSFIEVVFTFNYLIIVHFHCKSWLTIGWKVQCQPFTGPSWVGREGSHHITLMPDCQFVPH